MLHHTVKRPGSPRVPQRERPRQTAGQIAV